MINTEKQRTIEVTVKLIFMVNESVSKRTNRNTRLDIGNYDDVQVRDNERGVCGLLDDYEVVSVEDLPV